MAPAPARSARWRSRSSASRSTSYASTLPSPLERRGEQQRLAPGSGTQVQDAHSRAGLDQRSGELTSLVLDLEQALLVRGEAEDVGSPLEVERVGRVPPGVAGDALGAEALGERVAVEAQAVGAHGHRSGHVAGSGEERRLGAERVLELGDERVRPREPRGPVVGGRPGLGELISGPGADRVCRQMRDVPEEPGQHRPRSRGAGMVGEPATPERDAEERLGGDRAVRRVPSRMRAQEHREQPRGVTSMEHRAERLEDLSPDLRQLRPVDLGEPVPRGALERLECRGSRPRGGPGGHGRRMPDPGPAGRDS